MKSFSGFRANLLAAFVLLTLGVVACMGAAGWIGSASLGRYLLEKQADRIMAVLVEAEKEARAAKDRNGEEPLESGKLAEVLEWRFLVGKEVPRKWLDLENGMHFLADQKKFVLLARSDGTPYALDGSLDGYYSLRGNTLLLLLVCGTCGLLAAIILALALSKYLSRPLQDLTGTVEKRSGAILSLQQDLPPFPPRLLALKNEVGILARELARNEVDLHAFLWRESCFNGDVSHELRTPLTIIQGGLEILERDLAALPQPERQNSLAVLARLSRTVTDMSATVRALLLLAREPQRLACIVMDISAFTLNALREWQTAGLFRLKISSGQSAEACQNESGSKIVFANIAPEQKAKGNTELAGVVLKNLIANAMLYSDDGHVQVRLANGVLKILNHGAPPPNIDLFARGTRGSGKSGGHGFGLSIALRACEKLGWQLEYETTGLRTVFTVTFAKN